MWFDVIGNLVLICYVLCLVFVVDDGIVVDLVLLEVMGEVVMYVVFYDVDVMVWVIVVMDGDFVL
ncbi:hypothetical protein DF186_14200 [Enterococcus hirae]|nr:hypothetical protein DF186_14200 [Enterococcus hirae]